MGPIFEDRYGVDVFVTAEPIAAQDAIAIPVSGIDFDDESVNTELAPFRPSRESLRRVGFRARLGETVVVQAPSTKINVVFGVGKRLSDGNLRLGAMKIGEKIATLGQVHVDLTAYSSHLQARYGAALAEGVILGSYRWSESEPVMKDGCALILHTNEYLNSSIAESCRRAAVRASAANWARQLTDTPPSDLTPSDLAELANELGRSHHWRREILGSDELKAAGLNGILAVGRGSTRSPYLIDLEYTGLGKGPAEIVLIGKGITMDCGGLNPKTDPKAAEMKSDMAGAASVIACLSALTKLEVRRNVRLLVPAAENLPGPDAIRPGDVITHLGGRRTEVSLTDAEGRLVLADCLAYARQHSESATLIDVGTLSGSPFAPAGWTAVTQNWWLGQGLVHAAEATGELCVHVPLIEEYASFIDSGVADAKNFSFEYASQDLMIAAAFLAPFAGTNPWAHVEVFGCAYLFDPWSTWSKGATGSPTRPLIDLVARWSEFASEGEIASSPNDSSTGEPSGQAEAGS